MPQPQSFSTSFLGRCRTVIHRRLRRALAGSPPHRWNNCGNRISRARSASDEVFAVCNLGAPAVCIDGLVRFADFGMSGSDLRNRWSRCVSECRGGKLASPSRARAEQCGYLARGTSASVRSVTAWSPSGLAPCRTGKLFQHAQAAGLGVILLCVGRGEASRPLKLRRRPQT